MGQGGRPIIQSPGTHFQKRKLTRVLGWGRSFEKVPWELCATTTNPETPMSAKIIFESLRGLCKVGKQRERSSSSCSEGDLGKVPQGSVR